MNISLVEEAISYSNPIKMETLLALGFKSSEIEKIAKKTLVKESNNIEIAKNWRNLNKKKNLENLVLGEIFDSDSKKAEELIQFFLASGGSFHSIASFIASAKLPGKLEKQLQFLEIIQRTLKIEEQFLQEHPPKKKKDNNAEEIDVTTGLFLKLLQSDAISELFHSLCAKGAIDLVSELIDFKVDVDIPYPDTGASPLHTAVWNGKSISVNWLLDHEANINAKTKEKGETPLHTASSKGNIAIVRILLNRGANLEIPTKEGHTPLHYACSNDQETALLLMQKGANIHATTKKGETPLHYACLKGYTKLALELLKEGADPSIIDSFNKTPLQAALKEEGLREFIESLFASNLKVLEILKGKSLNEFIAYLKSHPEDLMLSSNPLEAPFLFHDTKMIQVLKYLMGPDGYAHALDLIQEKYPKLTPKALIDVGLIIEPSIVYKLFSTEVPQVPNIELTKLKALFGNVQFLWSKKLTDLKQNEVHFFQRKGITKKDLQTVDLSQRHPFVIMQIDDILMPVKVFKKDHAYLIEPRVELLLALLRKINFSDKKGPGYRDPEKIVDSGGDKVSPEQLIEGIQTLSKAINYRIPYHGTPSADQPEELEVWYQYLESLVKHILVSSINEDADANAPFIIELAISGLHCGTRSLDDAQHGYNTKFNQPKTVQETILGFIEKFKLGIVQDMVDLTHSHNVHIKNKILQVIDEECGIPQGEKKKRFYFNDPIPPKGIDKEKIMLIFNSKFDASAIIDLVDKAINGHPSQIDKELIIDWFKDNIPKDWKSDKYEYLGNVVMDMITGKIKRTAIIYMLTCFGVFKGNI